MPERPGLNELAERKRLLILQADLHRSLAAASSRSLHARFSSAQEALHSNHWWLLGGTATLGLLLGGKWRGLARWVPTGIALWRFVHRLRAEGSQTHPTP
jgi:hypothetical protein